MTCKGNVKARISLALVLVFVFSLSLPAMPAEKVAQTADNGKEPVAENWEEEGKEHQAHNYETSELEMGGNETKLQEEVNSMLSGGANNSLA